MSSGDDASLATASLAAPPPSPLLPQPASTSVSARDIINAAGLRPARLADPSPNGNFFVKVTFGDDQEWFLFLLF